MEGLKKVLTPNSSPSKRNIEKHNSTGHMSQGDESFSPSRSFSKHEQDTVSSFLSKLELGDLCFSELIDYGFVLLG